MKPATKRTVLALLCVAALGLAALWGFRAWVLNLAAAPGGAAKLVEIPRGSGQAAVAELLAREGIIAKPLWFLAAARFTQEAGPLKAGEYELSPALSQEAILAILRSGRVYQHVVLIPEGFTLQEIVDRLAEAGLVDRKAALALAKDRAFLDSLDLTKAESLEGYLFPDTYRLARGLGARAVLGLMVRRGNQAWRPLEAKATEMGFSRGQTLTLASIIEKEARVDAERPLISAVYHNRLKKGMLLQADPTVIYGLGGLDRPLLRADLEKDNPYNTYQRPGLPPGPICSPGEASLLAAVDPARVNYLYFVADGSGRHVFSRDYAGQVAAIREVRRRH
ncbi:MAG: endolytic transglycosylase MltG [Deltaproteobacteria bacterium]|nr:endolytic transglycosylase MltG [Deltaproteobacteria bacterium]